ncbi:MAG: hypothetical protein OQK25_07340 [Gammaproteobacteria bacterium]|nr:hypothetical protein [Gammaproteobacteria bacterium]
MRNLLLLLLAFTTFATVAAENPIAVKPITVYYVDDESFEDIKENVASAITDRGLTVSGTLHVQEMLDRTGDDLGFGKGPYLKAESLEFCSAFISHKMIKTHPYNMGICPFTIAIYILHKEPSRVYVAYNVPSLAGDAEEVMEEVIELLDGVVKDSIE